MINELTRIYKAESKLFNEVESRVFYDRGVGYVYRIIPRKSDKLGYMYVCSWGWKSGYRAMVVPCTRQSKKRYEEAVARLNELEALFIPQLERESEGKLKVVRNDFTQEERDRYAK